MCVAMGCWLLLAPDARGDATPKVMHSVFGATDDGFDGARTANVYSLMLAEAVFQTLLTYDYLARPAKLVPLAAEALPEVTDDGRTYTFHLRKGLAFAPDP